MESWVNLSGKEGHPNIQPSTRPRIKPGTSGLGGRDLNHCANPLRGSSHFGNPASRLFFFCLPCHVLQTLREQLKVPGSRLEGSELLTSEFLRFRSRLNETSGGLGKIGAVSGSDCGILKFLRTTFLAAKLLGWKVSVKGIRSSLSEADGSKADSLLTFWTRLSALDKMLSG